MPHPSSRANRGAETAADRAAAGPSLVVAGAGAGGSEISGLSTAEPCRVDRWFALAGSPPRADLARSGAPGRCLSDVLALASPAERDDYLGLSLDYGPGEGTEQLRDALARSGFARTGSEVVVTNGAVEALLLACAAACAANRRNNRVIAVATPAYEGILRCAQAGGASVLPVQVWRSGRPDLTLDGFDDAVVSRCSAVLVNSPHNPTGLAIERGALTDLAERCRRHGATLIVDEVALGTLDHRATSFAVAPAFCTGGVVTIGDVSKSLGLGGLRIGWLTTASSAFLEHVRMLRDLTSLASAAPSQALASIALRRRAELSCTSVAARNLAYLGCWARSWGGTVTPAPHDGLVAFPRLPLPVPSLEFAAAARRAEVSVMPGALFGCEGHLRIGLGIAPTVFAGALATLGGLLGPSGLLGPRRRP